MVASKLLILSLVAFGNAQKSVVIVGGGAFGMSTAYWLAKDPAKYTSIKVLDPYPAPSFASGTHNFATIVRTEQVDPLYSFLANEAYELWSTDPVFAPEFTRTGNLFGTYDQLNSSEFDTSIQNTQNYGNARDLQWITGDPRVAFLQWPWFQGVPPVGFRGAWNANGGWVNNTSVLDRLSRYLNSLAPVVQVISGPRGDVRQLVREDPGGRVAGVLTADGTWHRSDIVIVAAGAWTGGLVDLQGQGWPEAAATTSVRLTAAERTSLSNSSTFEIVGPPGARQDQYTGQLIPPGPAGLLKLVARTLTRARYTRLDTSGRRVAPAVDAAHRPTNQLPAQDATDYRQFLRTWYPQFANHPFVGSQVGWTLSTFDSTWLIGSHPSSPQNLFVATGGGYASFKFIVNVGKYVRDAVEGTLHPNYISAFSWRPERVAPYGAPPTLLNLETQPLVNDGDGGAAAGPFGPFGGLFGGKGNKK